MEASQRKGGKYPNAQLVSPMYYKGAYNCKFTFWYNMYHFDRKIYSDVRLNVFYRRNGRDTKLWSSQKSTGNKWKQATVKLPPCPSDFRVSFCSLLLNIVLGLEKFYVNVIQNIKIHLSAFYETIKIN